jgi:hypothetical protein
MQENNHKIKWYSRVYFRKGKTTINQVHGIMCSPTRPLPISWQSSQIVFGSSFSMHVPGVGGIHCFYLLHVRGRHQDRQPHATTAANRDNATRGMSQELPRTPVAHAHSPPLLSPNLSHRINVICSPCLIKGRARSSRQTLWLVLFTSSFSSQEEVSFIFSLFNLEPPVALKNYRDLGTCPSLAHL